MKRNTTKNHPAQQPADPEASRVKTPADTSPEASLIGSEAGPIGGTDDSDMPMAFEASGSMVDDTPDVTSDIAADVVPDIASENVSDATQDDYETAPDLDMPSAVSEQPDSDEEQSELEVPDETGMPVSSVRRIDAPGPSTSAMLIRSRITAMARTLSGLFKSGGTSFSTLVSRGFHSLRGFIRQRRRKGSRRTAIGSADRIRRTDRERVYKLRGYTTFEKVNAKRKAQRRFKLAQRILITILCIGSLGYIAFSNNPFTDVDELLRIIGIRNTVSISFQQFAFPLTLLESADASISEIPPEQDLVQLIMNNGTEDDVFYYQAFQDVDALKAALTGCRRTILDEDVAKIARDPKIGTILVLIAKEGNTSTYRFSDVKQSGVMVDVNATTIVTSGGDSTVYLIGLLSEKSYLGYSFDIIPVAAGTTTTVKST